jgi:hypothetical protein
MLSPRFFFWQIRLYSEYYLSKNCCKLFLAMKSKTSPVFVANEDYSVTCKYYKKRRPAIFIAGLSLTHLKILNISPIAFAPHSL